MIFPISKQELISALVLSFVLNLIFILIFKSSDLLLWFGSLLD